MPSSTSAGIFWGPNKGIILRPDVTKSFEVHVDCDFAGNWNKEDAMIDPSTTKSQTGYVISYAGCPTIWASELQTEVVLFNTESEYVGLSESLRIAIVMMNLLKEMQEQGVDVPKTNPVVYCKLFEDNAGAIHWPRPPRCVLKRGTSNRSTITSGSGSRKASLRSSQLIPRSNLQTC
jgi:hypothetical protein